jgi:hypothetical protein
MICSNFSNCVAAALLRFFPQSARETSAFVATVAMIPASRANKCPRPENVASVARLFTFEEEEINLTVLP